MLVSVRARANTARVRMLHGLEGRQVRFSPKMATLENKVRRLLDMLDEVERGFQQEPDAIHRELALHLVDRLQEVAEVIETHDQLEYAGSTTTEEDSDTPQIGVAGDQVQCPRIKILA